MTDSLQFFCLINGESASSAFSVKIPSSWNVSELKELIKTKQSPAFDDIPANKLSLWRVSIPVVAATRHDPITIMSLESKEELLPTSNISEVFDKGFLKKAIHIIVQHNCQVNDIDGDSKSCVRLMNQKNDLHGYGDTLELKCNEPRCGLTFQSTRILQEHIESHQLSYCSRCKLPFLTSDDLMDHYDDHDTYGHRILAERPLEKDIDECLWQHELDKLEESLAAISGSKHTKEFILQATEPLFLKFDNGDTKMVLTLPGTRKRLAEDELVSVKRKISTIDSKIEVFDSQIQYIMKKI